MLHMYQHTYRYKSHQHVFECVFNQRKLVKFLCVHLFVVY